MYKRNVPLSVPHNSEAGGQQELLTPSIILLFLYLRETTLTRAASYKFYGRSGEPFPVTAGLVISLPLPLLVYHTDLLHHVIMLIFSSRGGSCLLVCVQRTVP